MNKREFIERLINMRGCGAKCTSWERGWDDAISDVIIIAEELVEPELTQRQVDKWLDDRDMVAVDTMMVHQTGTQNKVVVEKPVIPQFAADYIEKWKYETLIMHEWFTFDHDDQDEDKVSKWLYNNDYETNKRRELILIDAIRYGYEVEKEPKYYVLDKEGATLLKKRSVSEGIAKSVGTTISSAKSWKDEKKYQLTEQEIKDYDERYIPFMVPVDEVNND